MTSKVLLLLSSMTILFFSSCEKEMDEPLKGVKEPEFKFWCSLDNSTITTDDTFINQETIPPKMTVYILEELKVDASCNCIVSGKVKYVENCCMTASLVDYGDGECDEWVSITLCYFGDCEGPDAQCMKYKQSCEINPSTIVEDSPNVK